MKNTNICCSVQESLDFLEIKELGDLDLYLDGDSTGGPQGHAFLTASGNSVQRALLTCMVEMYSPSTLHFTVGERVCCTLYE